MQGTIRKGFYNWFFEDESGKSYKLEREDIEFLERQMENPEDKAAVATKSAVSTPPGYSGGAIHKGSLAFM